MTIKTSDPVKNLETFDRNSIPDDKGRFGPYGGSFVPETLCYPLQELSEAYDEAKSDPEFKSELDDLLKSFAGRPTELYYAERLSKKIGGAKIYLKRRSPPHRSTQDQQCPRPSTSCTKNG